MRPSSILKLLTLAMSVVAGVPDCLRASTDIDSSMLPEPGCANFYGNDQRITLYSGGRMFEMWIPTDGETYSVGKPFARLSCNEVSVSSYFPIRDPICAECYDRMNYVQVETSGSCSFALTNDQNKIVTMKSDQTKGKNPFPIAGFLALVTCHKPNMKAVWEAADTQLSCTETHDSKMTIGTGSSEYILSVPANQAVFDVIGPDSKLRCVSPIGWKYDMCQACNFPVQRLILSTAAGICAFNFSGYTDLVYHNARYGSLSLPSPTQIWSVQCGLAHLSVDARDVISETRSDPVNCPDLHDKTIIKLVEEGTGVNFDLEIPHNGTRYQIGQPPYDVGCRRRDKVESDRCFPCPILLAEVRIDHVDCYLEFSYPEGVIAPLEMWHGPLEMDHPFGYGEKVTLLSIFCLKQPVSEKRSPQTLKAEYGTSRIETTDDACQSSGYKIAIQTADGNVYFTPVSMDHRFHPMAEMMCVRLKDATCIPCSEIGKAVSVNTEVQWGPCIFFTDDRRQFFTQYWNDNSDGSKVTPLTAINPGAVISGIECGSSA